jgi:hypothetical protein
MSNRVQKRNCSLMQQKAPCSGKTEPATSPPLWHLRMALPGNVVPGSVLLAKKRGNGGLFENDKGKRFLLQRTRD